ncbi:hypothetical protein BV22DRAFT_387715 [Leucogyrophana mollusca]|uniref:Uncharacterized protein n=1 Tax=Leucogyrophana mollusca TaxID=85980 RepID=A0ACB8BKW9_9AGAM|nr:hypothetical protein BV22DRAFT_387715 [Leucogyrophana mollusca]
MALLALAYNTFSVVLLPRPDFYHWKIACADHFIVFAVEWEGPEAVEGFTDTGPVDDKPPVVVGASFAPPPSESEGDPSSDDEYVVESDKGKGKRSVSTTKRRTRRLSLSSDSDEASDKAGRAPKRDSTRKQSISSQGTSANKDASGSQLKRKSQSTAHPPAPKRKKSAETSSNEDPARKYCLGKLQETFSEIFLKYPHTDSTEESSGKVEQNVEEINDEDKKRLEEVAKAFATELEQCVFDIYSEPDKHGKQSAGPKYKERFRMLTFNLSKPDRVVIHKRIASSGITAKELALMSSTDLANEETKQSIKIAEKESLEQTILQKTTVPRAKITHKGLQDIEDVNGELASVREREREREIEDEERRERERQARLKAAQQQQQQRATSATHGSVPPESPVVPHTPSWGGPPTLPMHVLHTNDQYLSSPVDGGRGHPIYAHSASDMHTLPEPELNLADLINLDDDPPPPEEQPSTSAPGAPALTIDTSPTSIVPAPPPSSAHSPGSREARQIGADAVPQTALSTSATSPRSSFDLSSLWSSSMANPPPPPPPPPPEVAEAHDNHIVVDVVEQEASDQDFDMFLEKDQEVETSETSQPAPDPEAVFHALPLVWTGKVSMPLDSAIPQEANVVARQIGGRSLGDTSPLWSTLFPSDTLRIEGRVPSDVSAQFLLQMRMNSQKELIAVAFSPNAEDGVLQTFSDFLLRKSRHGLVFPWGNSPKEYHPGKELYMVPLLANQPLPDFVEVLDELRLPKARKSNYVLGVWVLTKGKLAPLPAPPPPMQVPPAPPSAVPSGPPVSAPANIPGFNPLPHPPIPSAPISPQAQLLAQAQLTNSSLAAEVASLTPEQIQMMLRTLSSGNGLPLSTVPAPMNGPPMAPPPPPIPQPIPQPQPWANNIPSFPPPYPNASGSRLPMNLPTQPRGIQSPVHPPHMMSPPRGGYNQGPYEQRGPGRDFAPGPGYDRPDRGGRGRGRGRGRGDSSYGAVDSGWPRNRSRSGGGEGPSGSRGRWDEPPYR